MTGALVSGRDGVAVFEDGSLLWCVRPQSPSPEPVSYGLLPHLFEDISDASYHPKATLESTSQLLEKACRTERALQLTLISMDAGSSDTTRELAEAALEEYLEDGDVSEFIENRLFSKPLPTSAFWKTELTSSDSQVCVKVSLLKRLVLRNQGDIARIRQEWDALPEDLFAKPEDRPRFESVLIETGAFRRLVNTASGGADQYSKGNAQVWILSNDGYRTFTNFRNILMRWTATALGSRRETVQPIHDDGDDVELSGRRNRAQNTSPHEAFQNVVLQKQAILEQLRRRNFERVESFVDDLIGLQLANDKPGLAAKSLCDLAKGAKELGFLAYQLDWSIRAREINPEDPFVQTQFGDALLGQGRLPEALAAYEATVRDFPENVVARTGKAEVLKALGRLPEALEAYEATVRDFPGDVVARSGMAEALKALGRLSEALAAYEAISHDFPENEIARNGRGTLLVFLGRYAEAEALLRTDETRTYGEWVALHIRGTSKLKQGHFNEADELLSAGERCFWDEPRSRFIATRAVLRVKMRRLKEAESIIRSQHSLISKVIQIDVYRRMNKVSEAQSILRELRECRVADIAKISRDLEQNMKPGRRTISDDEFLDREIELLLAA